MTSVRRGITLVELLVAAALTALVITLAFAYLIPATKAAQKMLVRAQMQQTAAVALSQIRMAAATTSPAGFSWCLSESVVAVSFNPLEDVQPANAALRWSPAFDVFWWEVAGHSLKRRSWPPGDPIAREEELTLARAKRLVPERLAEVASLGQLLPASKTLARGVLDFKLSQEGLAEGALVQPIRLDLTLIEEGYEDRLELGQKVFLSLVFRMENQL